MKYERTMCYVWHCLRAEQQRFTALTEAQYNALCDKIEAM